MKTYVVTFAHTRGDADLRVSASSHRFGTLKEAREYADNYWNTYITVIECGEIVGYCKTRADLREAKNERRNGEQ